MKKNNPHTPIMIREALGIEPRVYARYEYGREKMADLKGEAHQGPGTYFRNPVTYSSAGLDDKAIEDKVTGLVKGEA